MNVLGHSSMLFVGVVKILRTTVVPPPSINSGSATGTGHCVWAAMHQMDVQESAHTINNHKVEVKKFGSYILHNLQ